MRRACPPRGLVVADLCTGSGVVAIAAASGGARQVDAFDLSASAAMTARANVRAAGGEVAVHQSSWLGAVSAGPYDLVVCNPPDVPETPEDVDAEAVSAAPASAVNRGVDGRLVLDPLCAVAPALPNRGGTLLVVQSEIADIGQTVAILNGTGLRASVAAQSSVPFGPVMRSRAHWLEHAGRLQLGRRHETLAVIAAVKR